MLTNNPTTYYLAVTYALGRWSAHGRLYRDRSDAQAAARWINQYPIAGETVCRILPIDFDPAKMAKLPANLLEFIAEELARSRRTLVQRAGDTSGRYALVSPLGVHRVRLREGDRMIQINRPPK